MKMGSKYYFSLPEKMTFCHMS